MIPDSAVTAIQDGVKTEVINVQGEQYTTRPVFLLPEERTYKPNALLLNTLGGIVDYVKSYDDPIAKEGIKGILIDSPTIVFLFGALGGIKQERSTYVKSTAVLGSQFPFKTYQPQEDFLIQLGACFHSSPDRDAVANVASNVMQEDAVTLSDDGLSQTVSTKSGVAGVKRVTIQNPVTLYPYRTFAEIDQPAGQYIFRQQKGRNGPEFALFPIEDSAWILTAKASIKAFFAAHLPEMVVVG